MVRVKPDGLSPKPSQDRPRSKLNPNFWYVNGIAYDFEPFVKSHPGGQYALYLGKGNECLGLLHSYHFKIPDQAFLDKYRCPDKDQLQNFEQEKFPMLEKFTFEKGGFLDTVKREAMDHFRRKGISHKADWFHIIMFFLNVAAILLSMNAMCTWTSGWISLLAACAFHGVMRAVLVVQTTHGASHFSFVKSPMGNRWAYRIGTILIGLWAPPVWDLQHVVAHHVWTNEWPYDSDSAFPLKSILSNQRRFWYHRYQYIYMWVVYTFTIPLVMLNSFKDIIIQKQVTFKMRFLAPNARLEAYGCSVLSLAYLALPFFFQPFWTALWVVNVSSMISSLYFSLQFVVNHEVDSIIDVPTPNYPIDWGIHQVMGSLTFAPNNRLSLEMAGGLNTQIEHHLFPGVHYSHYNDLSPIIRRVCKQFGVNYQYRDSLVDALKAHYNLLKDPPKSIRA
jgi:linoleoyl-CoA desaturase